MIGLSVLNLAKSSVFYGQLLDTWLNRVLSPV